MNYFGTKIKQKETSYVKNKKRAISDSERNSFNIIFTHELEISRHDISLINTNDLFNIASSFFKVYGDYKNLDMGCRISLKVNSSMESIDEFRQTYRGITMERIKDLRINYGTI